MYNFPGYIFEFFCRLLEQPAVFLEKALIDEIVTFDPGKGVCEIVFLKPFRSACWALNSDCLTFPASPCFGGISALYLVFAGETFVKCV